MIQNDIELHNSGYIIRTQIKCLQNINVLKYTPNARKNKNERLPYFEYCKETQEINEDDNEENVFVKETAENK